MTRSAFVLSRRVLMASGGAVLGLSGAMPAMAKPRRRPIVNPLVLNRADPQIIKEDGWYYLSATVPEYDRLVLRRARTIEGLATAAEVLIWKRPDTGTMGGYIWAPELHRFDGKWHIYFGAGDHGDVFHVRTYVIACDAADPMTGAWQVLGKVEMPWDTFNLDSTVFEHRGQRYLCWAQHEPGIDTNSNLYLAPMASATTFSAKPIRLTVPTLPWEIIGFKVNEGPAVVAHGDHLFLTYSASATDEHYCLGLLSVHVDADLMDPASWTKSQEPVFKSSPAHNVWGPGHNSFTVDEKGRDVIVYHARDYREIQGDPLNDPNRHTRVQLVHWRADGTPDFGEPVANGVLG